MSDQTCDVAVIGGGLVGAALAYELASRGTDVVLVDDHHPGRASDAGAGILSPETTWNPDQEWFSFGLAVGRPLPDPGGPTGRRRGQRDRLHRVRIAAAGHRAGRRRVVRHRGRIGLSSLARPSCREVTGDEARELFPPLGEIRRGLHNPVAGPGRRPADDGRPAPGGPNGTACDSWRRRPPVCGPTRGRVVGVDSDAGALSCGAVAIAGGAWSPTFGRQLGIGIPVTPVKGQIVHMQLPATDDGGPVDSARWPIVEPVLNHYLVAWPGGRVACGGTYESDAGFDTRPTVAGLEQLLRAGLAIAPGTGRGHPGRCAGRSAAGLGRQPARARPRSRLGQRPPGDGPRDGRSPARSRTAPRWWRSPSGKDRSPTGCVPSACPASRPDH